MKGIASSGKANGWEWEVIFDHAYEILNKYMKEQPERTVRILMGEKEFTVDDLLKKALAITLGQCMRLDDTFVEVSPDNFTLKEMMEK